MIMRVIINIFLHPPKAMNGENRYKMKVTGLFREGANFYRRKLTSPGM